MINSAVWFTTMLCNFKCPYCVLTKTPNWEVLYFRDKPKNHAPIRPASEWLEVFNKLQPQVLDLTGGEPFAMPDLVDFIEGLNPRTRVAMTSNLSYTARMERFFTSEICKQKMLCMTLSFHPSQGGEEYAPDFLAKAKRLRRMGIKLTVNFVAWPEQMMDVPKWKDYFEDYGFTFHVEPFVRTDGVESYTPEQWDFLKQYVAPSRKPDVPEGIRVMCNGGIKHLSIQADGTAYRCLYDAQFGLRPVGNVFSPDFAPLSLMTPCDVRFDCRGCDKDKVAVIPVGPVEQPA